jgi:hypothetical protein
MIKSGARGVQLRNPVVRCGGQNAYSKIIVPTNRPEIEQKSHGAEQGEIAVVYFVVHPLSRHRRSAFKAAPKVQHESGDIKTQIIAGVCLELCQRLGVLADRSGGIPVRKVVASNGCLDQSLKEQPPFTPFQMPEIFKDIVAFEELFPVKELDTTRESRFEWL